MRNAARRITAGRWWILLALVLVVAIIAGAWAIGPWRSSAPGPDSTADCRRQAADSTGVVGVFVQPDDGREPVVAELDAAQCSIDLMIYLISDDEIMAALGRAVARGVEVRVLLEEHPFGGPGGQPEIYDDLAATGIDVRWGNPVFRFTHVKTFVVDERVAVIMNQNLSRTAFENNRELGVVTTRPADVAQALAIFESDWERTGEPATGPLVVSPTTSREKLIGLIESAEQSVDLYAEVMRDAEAMTALTDAAQRGIQVRLIMTDSSDEGNREAQQRLMQAGVDVRLTGGLSIHAKLILVDDERAFIGSQNLTATSLDANREIGIILNDPTAIERIMATFERDFNGAVVDAQP